MADRVQFELVTPERLLLSEMVEMVVVPGTEGNFGVLPGHAPLISSIRPGTIEIYEGQTEERTVFDQEGADDKLKEWISRHRGRRTFFLYERFQQARLQGLLPSEARGSFRVIDEQNNKFSLAQADL